MVVYTYEVGITTLTLIFSQLRKLKFWAVNYVTQRDPVSKRARAVGFNSKANMFKLYTTVSPTMHFQIPKG